MNFQTLRLVNFRNYKKAEICLYPKSLVIGRNGIGKSNLLEALFLIATGKSFRGVKNRSLIYDGEDEARICAEVGNKKKDSFRIDIKRENRSSAGHFRGVATGWAATKLLYINNKKRSSVELLGQTPSVIFAPEQLAIIQESPRVRRSFLDLLIAQTDRAYAKNLFRLSRVLKNRNRLLSEIREAKARVNELEFWDQELVDLGTKITVWRIKVIEAFNTKVKNYYQKISKTRDSLSFTYESSVTGRIDKTPDSRKFRECFLNKLKKKQSLELSIGQSLVGPHRDNPQISFNQQSISEFGSRGEARSALIALKFAEFDYIKDYHQVAPIFLFDDVFSELDQYRTQFLLENLPDASQLIFTATTLPKNLKNSRFEVIDLEKCLKK